MLTYVCPSCRAKAGLDSVICAAVEDSEARRLIEYLVLQHQPTLGAHLIRYLRLHAPAKNRLSMARTRDVLGEITEAIKARRITYRGRDWQALVDDWRAALDVVFKDAEDGKLRLPLGGYARRAKHCKPFARSRASRGSASPGPGNARRPGRAAR